jgi:hypothetical protein
VLVDVYILFIIEIVYAYHLVCSCIVRLHENDQICLFGYIIVSSSSTSQCCQQQPAATEMLVLCLLMIMRPLDEAKLPISKAKIFF